MSFREVTPVVSYAWGHLPSRGLQADPGLRRIGQQQLAGASVGLLLAETPESCHKSLLPLVFLPSLLPSFSLDESD